MPKLLQISLSVSNHSVGGIAKAIGHCAIQNGWESYITYTDRIQKSDCDSHLIKIGSKLDYACHAILTRLTDKHGLGSSHATRKLIKHIEELKPDVIQIQNLHGYYLNYKILFEYLNKTEIPIVWTFHDCWSFTGHCAHFVSANCSKWKEGCHHCQLKGSYPHSWFDNSSANYNLKKKLFTTNNNLHIITVSKWLSDFVKESFFKNTDIRVIHNGIDLDIFRSNKYSEQSDTFTILGVSRIWTKSKGLYDFYKLRERLDSRYQIILVGLTKEQQDALPGGIKGITRTRDLQELKELYAMADIFVNLTYADSFPTVNLEALACGTPVITYKTGGSPEAVDSNTGFVVNQGDLEGVINSIIQIQESSDKFSFEQCRERAEKFFNKEKCFQQYIDLYNELISNRK